MLPKCNVLISAAAAALTVPVPVVACTGLTLKSAQGDVVPARTVEWAGSRFNSQYVVVPRGHAQQSFTPQGRDGMSFTSRYGYAGLSCELPEFMVDGVNEKGLCCELFFFPDYGSYAPFDASQKAVTVGDMQLVQLLLGSCASIADVRERLGQVRVVGLETAAGAACHWRVTQPDGEQVVIEIVDEGKVNIYESIGVLTNSPAYPWHLTNLDNYINLYPGSAPAHKLGSYELKPISGGSGLLGLPGDYTSPSRFVRVAFFQATARTQATVFGTVSQALQILNNFDIPIGTAYSEGAQVPDMLTATQWTVATDLTNRRIYYRTGVNGHIRCVDLGKLDLGKAQYSVHPVDDVTEQPVEMVPLQ